MPNANTNPTPTSQPPADSQLPVSPSVIIGVSAGSVEVLALLACIFSTAFIIKQRSHRTDLTENVAYSVYQNEAELKDNEAYTATATGGGVGEEYDYIMRTDNITITATPNEAYGITIHTYELLQS